MQAAKTSAKAGEAGEISFSRLHRFVRSRLNCLKHQVAQANWADNPLYSAEFVYLKAGYL